MNEIPGIDGREGGIPTSSTFSPSVPCLTLNSSSFIEDNARSNGKVHGNCDAKDQEVLPTVASIVDPERDQVMGENRTGVASSSSHREAATSDKWEIPPLDEFSWKSLHPNVFNPPTSPFATPTKDKRDCCFLCGEQGDKVYEPIVVWNKHRWLLDTVGYIQSRLLSDYFVGNTSPFASETHVHGDSQEYITNESSHSNENVNSCCAGVSGPFSICAPCTERDSSTKSLLSTSTKEMRQETASYHKAPENDITKQIVQNSHCQASFWGPLSSMPQIEQTYIHSLPPLPIPSYLPPLDLESAATNGRLPVCGIGKCALPHCRRTYHRACLRIMTDIITMRKYEEDARASGVEPPIFMFQAVYDYMVQLEREYLSENIESLDIYDPNIDNNLDLRQELTSFPNTRQEGQNRGELSTNMEKFPTVESIAHHSIDKSFTPNLRKFVADFCKLSDVAIEEETSSTLPLVANEIAENIHCPEAAGLLFRHRIDPKVCLSLPVSPIWLTSGSCASFICPSHDCHKCSSIYVADSDPTDPANAVSLPLHGADNSERTGSSNLNCNSTLENAADGHNPSTEDTTCWNDLWSVYFSAHKNVPSIAKSHVAADAADSHRSSNCNSQGILFYADNLPQYLVPYLPSDEGFQTVKTRRHVLFASHFHNWLRVEKLRNYLECLRNPSTRVTTLLLLRKRWETATSSIRQVAVSRLSSVPFTDYVPVGLYSLEENMPLSKRLIATDKGINLVTIVFPTFPSPKRIDEVERTVEKSMCDATVHAHQAPENTECQRDSSPGLEHHVSLSACSGNVKSGSPDSLRVVEEDCKSMVVFGSMQEHEKHANMHAMELDISIAAAFTNDASAHQGQYQHELAEVTATAANPISTLGVANAENTFQQEDFSVENPGSCSSAESSELERKQKRKQRLLKELEERIYLGAANERENGEDLLAQSRACTLWVRHNRASTSELSRSDGEEIMSDHTDCDDSNEIDMEEDDKGGENLPSKASKLHEQQGRAKTSRSRKKQSKMTPIMGRNVAQIEKANRNVTDAAQKYLSGMFSQSNAIFRSNQESTGISYERRSAQKHHIPENTFAISNSAPHIAAPIQLSTPIHAQDHLTFLSTDQSTSNSKTLQDHLFRTGLDDLVSIPSACFDNKEKASRLRTEQSNTNIKPMNEDRGDTPVDTAQSSPSWVCSCVKGPSHSSTPSVTNFASINHDMSQRAIVNDTKPALLSMCTTHLLNHHPIYRFQGGMKEWLETALPENAIKSKATLESKSFRASDQDRTILQLDDNTDEACRSELEKNDLEDNTKQCDDHDIAQVPLNPVKLMNPELQDIVHPQESGTEVQSITSASATVPSHNNRSPAIDLCPTLARNNTLLLELIRQNRLLQQESNYSSRQVIAEVIVQSEIPQNVNPCNSSVNTSVPHSIAAHCQVRYKDVATSPMRNSLSYSRFKDRSHHPSPSPGPSRALDQIRKTILSNMSPSVLYNAFQVVGHNVLEDPGDDKRDTKYGNRESLPLTDNNLLPTAAILSSHFLKLVQLLIEFVRNIVSGEGTVAQTTQISEEPDLSPGFQYNVQIDCALVPLFQHYLRNITSEISDRVNCQVCPRSFHISNVVGSHSQPDTICGKNSSKERYILRRCIPESLSSDVTVANSKLLDNASTFNSSIAYYCPEHEHRGPHYESALRSVLSHLANSASDSYTASSVGKYPYFRAPVGFSWFKNWTHLDLDVDSEREEEREMGEEAESGLYPELEMLREDWEEIKDDYRKRRQKLRLVCIQKNRKHEKEEEKLDAMRQYLRTFLPTTRAHHPLFLGMPNFSSPLFSVVRCSGISVPQHLPEGNFTSSPSSTPRTCSERALQIASSPHDPSAPTSDGLDSIIDVIHASGSFDSTGVPILYHWTWETRSPLWVPIRGVYQRIQTFKKRHMRQTIKNDEELPKEKAVMLGEKSNFEWTTEIRKKSERMVPGGETEVEEEYHSSDRESCASDVESTALDPHNPIEHVNISPVKSLGSPEAGLSEADSKYSDPIRLSKGQETEILLHLSLQSKLQNVLRVYRNTGANLSRTLTADDSVVLSASKQGKISSINTDIKAELDNSLFRDFRTQAHYKLPLSLAVEFDLLDGPEEEQPLKFTKIQKNIYVTKVTKQEMPSEVCTCGTSDFSSSRKTTTTIDSGTPSACLIPIHSPANQSGKEYSLWSTGDHPSGPNCGSNCVNRLLRVECWGGESEEASGGSETNGDGAEKKKPKGKTNVGNCSAGPNCGNRALQRNCGPEIAVVKTRGKGFGVIAKENIHPGDFIIEYVGEIISEEEQNRRFEIAKKNGEGHYYMMEINFNQVIDARYKANEARFINHSCDPNAILQVCSVIVLIFNVLFSFCATALISHPISLLFIRSFFLRRFHLRPFFL